MSVLISPCETYRYRLERDVSSDGILYAYFGVNGSTATAVDDDQSVTECLGFTKLNDGRRFIVGNAFAYRSTDVGERGRASDPIRPENDAHLDQII